MMTCSHVPCCFFQALCSDLPGECLRGVSDWAALLEADAEAGLPLTLLLLVPPPLLGEDIPYALESRV